MECNSQAVPNEKGTVIIAESTANGLSNVFHELWRGAVNGSNGYLPVFVPWYIDDSYVELVDRPLDRSPEEEEIASKYILSDEQLAFRRNESHKMEAYYLSKNIQQHRKKLLSQVVDQCLIRNSL